MVASKINDLLDQHVTGQCAQLCVEFGVLGAFFYDGRQPSLNGFAC